MNGNGGGGVLKRVGPLRLQYYIVMGAVAAAVVLATLRYMPGPAAAAVGNSVARSGPAAAAAAAPGVGAVAATEEEVEVGAAEEEAEGKRKRKRKKGDGVVLFNFGDSNSDTGGVAAVMGIHIAPPEGRAYFHHPTGRLSDGRVILDFICECSLPGFLPPPDSRSPDSPLLPADANIPLLPPGWKQREKSQHSSGLAATNLGISAGNGGLAGRLPGGQNAALTAWKRVLLFGAAVILRWVKKESLPRMSWREVARIRLDLLVVRTIYNAMWSMW
jgi:hypothetical protein